MTHLLSNTQILTSGIACFQCGFGFFIIFVGKGGGGGR
jgi:hypothetical protein